MTPQPVVLYSRGGRILGATIAALTMISFVITLTTTPNEWFVVLGGHAIVIVLCWALGWYPAVLIDEDAATMRNIIRSHRIPFAAIDEVNTRFGLALHVGEKRYGSWAAPAPGALHRLRLDKSRIEHLPDSTYELGTVRPGDDPATESGVAALRIRRGMEAYVAQGIEDINNQVTTRWHFATITAGLISVALLVAAIL